MRHLIVVLNSKTSSLGRRVAHYRIMDNIINMDKFYHGTSVLFDRFDLSHVGEGEGKTKYGFGVNVTESVATAALYARKYSAADVTTHYVYTLEVPTIEDGNHYWSALPVSQHIIEKAEARLGEAIPDEAKNAGKLFRKYIGNKLIGNNTTIKKMIGAASLEAEKAASTFLLSIGVEMLVWPQSQTKPDGLQNRLIYDASKIKIVKIEQVSYDEKGKYIPGSEKEVIF